MFYELSLVVIAHRNYNLLPRRSFCYHIDFWLWLITTIYNLVNVINFVCLKHFFDFQDFASFWQQCLSIGFSSIPLLSLFIGLHEKFRDFINFLRYFSWNW